MAMSASIRPRILLLIPHLGGGGAERVTALLARNLPTKKYELHLGVMTQRECAPDEAPFPIPVHWLGARRVRDGAFRLLKLVYQLKPNIILSGMFHLNFLVLLLRPLFPAGTLILARQNGTVSSSLTFGGLPWYTRLLYRLLYRRADRIVCQTRAMAEDLARELELKESKLAILPNPVDVVGIRKSIGKQRAEWTGPGPNLLAVGRLSREKGFDLLLHALVPVRKNFSGLSLLIAGSGPEEAALKAERHALGLDTTVHFAGNVERPWRYFSKATLFVLSSRHEGLPNALLEAAAAGVPIVALPASAGVMELVSGQPGVWLAPQISSESLAASLLAALESLRPGERFAHSFVEQFRLDCAIGAYETLIDTTLESSARSGKT
jgi:glycosyltransferase involved in cell wall biosynthesis